MCNPCVFHTKHMKEIEEEKITLSGLLYFFLICEDLIFIQSTNSAAPSCVFGEGTVKSIASPLTLQVFIVFTPMIVVLE